MSFVVLVSVIEVVLLWSFSRVVNDDNYSCVQYFGISGWVSACKSLLLHLHYVDLAKEMFGGRSHIVNIMALNYFYKLETSARITETGGGCP